ncbi:MFS transporter, partial [Goekera deserti]
GGLLLALAVDNLGSGLFLPLVLLYSVRVVGLPVPTAGALLFAGTLVGLAAPLVVGAVVDRVGPRRVVISSQLLQAAGMGLYLLAGTGVGPGVAVALAAAGAVLVAAGTQTFYSSLFTLISAVAGTGPKDGAFAHVDMVRSAAFGVGALVAAGLLTWLDTPALRVVVAVDALSFLLAAALLRLLVTVDAPPPGHGPTDEGPAPRPWRDRPFLVLLVVIGLTGLAGDVFLVGFPVFALDQLHAPAWVPGACVALLTAVGATGTALVVRATSSWRRTRSVALGAALTLAWCLMCAAAPLVAGGWLPVWLLAATLVLAVAAVLTGVRVMAMAEASAPARARGRYLATVQYSFTAAQLAAPLVVASSALAAWLPWALVGTAGIGALLLLPWLGTRLPPRAVHVPVG